MRSWLDLKQFWWLSVSENQAENFDWNPLAESMLDLKSFWRHSVSAKRADLVKAFYHNLLVKSMLDMKQFWWLPVSTTINNFDGTRLGWSGLNFWKFYTKALMRSWLDLKQFWWLSVSENQAELLKFLAANHWWKECSIWNHFDGTPSVWSGLKFGKVSVQQAANGPTWMHQCNPL